MNPPTVVICGRPNVGKSSLFNSILKRRVAIVDPAAGVTRDRVSALVERLGREFILIDTGGIGLFDDIDLKVEVERQIETALRLADVILFLVDAKTGLIPADELIAKELRQLDKPMILVANKCDGVSIERELPELFGIGLGEPFPVSALERLGVDELVEEIIERLPPDDENDPSEPSEERIRLAIVGKVNSGKSTLVNLLVGEERVIVSDIPGTTRDAVDVPFERGGRKFVAIDTAGIRKRRVVEGTADFYGHARASEALRRADAVLLLVDATKKVSQIDKGIANEVARSAKPVVIGVSKWDLAKEAGKTTSEYEPYLKQQLPNLEFAPVTFLSAHAGINVDGTLQTCAEMYDQAGHRAATGPLNRLVERAMVRRFPRVGRGKFPKIKYITQTGVRPPTFVVFVNDKKLFGDEYARYLANRFREELAFEEVPLRIFFRETKREAKDD